MNVLLSEDRWFMSFELIKKETAWGWLGTSADRAARDMAIDGKIIRERYGKYARYRARRLTEKEKYDLYEPKIIPI